MSPQLDAFGIVVSDMARSLAFYRKLGLEFPDGAESEGHVEAHLAGGVRFMLDTEDVEVVRPRVAAPAGHVHAGAFRCSSPAEVDRVFAELSIPAVRLTKNRGTLFGASGMPRSKILTATSSICTRRCRIRQISTIGHLQRRLGSPI